MCYLRWIFLIKGGGNGGGRGGRGSFGGGGGGGSGSGSGGEGKWLPVNLTSVFHLMEEAELIQTSILNF